MTGKTPALRIGFKMTQTKRPTLQGHMTPLRRKRLLLLAQVPHNHKRWYSQYYHLINEGLVGWQFGTAFLTKEGKKQLLSDLGQDYDSIQ
jgi:hypothetical protein